MRICLIEGQEGVSWDGRSRRRPSGGPRGLFRSDHYRSILRGAPAGSLDAWTTLAALACSTRLRLDDGRRSPSVGIRAGQSVVTVDDVWAVASASARRRLGRGRARHVRFPVGTTSKDERLVRRLGDRT
jgi:hypothetical protein